jgi:hypothetical protein
MTLHDLCSTGISFGDRETLDVIVEVRGDPYQKPALYLIGGAKVQELLTVRWEGKQRLIVLTVDAKIQ